MKRLLIVFITLLTFLTLTACDLLEEIDIDNDPQQPIVTTIEIDETTLESAYFLEDFDLSTIHLILTYNDDTEEVVPLELQHILHADVHKLSELGTHTIEVNYTVFTTEFELTLISQEEVDDNGSDDEDSNIDNDNDLDDDINDEDRDDEDTHLDDDDHDEESLYYFPEEIEYDGPRLDPTFFDLVPYQEGGNPYRGTGGAFYVDYDPSNSIGRCIDGDTTVFWYPEEIYSKITANAKSTRYLNFDTPETWSGGEEPFGRLATLYVCDLLAQAELIVLQTDPGDNLVGNYGRLLAWVWILLPGDDDYQLLNYMVVRQGLGEVKYLFGAGETEVTMYNSRTYTEWMFYAEDQAILEERGMFGTKLDYYWDYETNQPDFDRWYE